MCWLAATMQCLQIFALGALYGAEGALYGAEGALYGAEGALYGAEGAVKSLPLWSEINSNVDAFD